MGRSFSQAAPAEEVADFYHAPSDSHYSFRVRGNSYVQRRWQIGPGGREINVDERAAAYVLGSGNHSKAWLARSAAGKLIELPLAWYSENGGYWALNPGYDTAHPPAQRPLTDECMFCHNGYPRVDAVQTAAGREPVYAAAELPLGIDCQRCHGPGENHVRVAQAAGSFPAAIRGAIVNPARLSSDRAMEVCMQCHLETASTRLPSLVRRFGRNPFSYIPGQPLGDFVISFDHAPGTSHDDKFEVAGAAYRLRQSRCFLASAGKLTCTSCHNPHDVPRGAQAVQHYDAACRTCHQLTDTLHASATDCAGCHMPKRRTEDAVHIVMTDHRIVRRPPAGDLLAPLAEKHPTASEEYRGPVVPYYPAPLGSRADDALYLASAQVLHGSNLEQGIDQLSALLRTQPVADFFVVLGNALRAAGQLTRSTEVLSRAAVQQPNDARALLLSGVTLLKQGDTEAGLRALSRSAEVDADVADVWNAIGAQRGAGGESELRRALQLDPWYASANASLATLLAARGERDEALYYFDKALGQRPGDASLRYEYALTLVQLNRFDESQTQVRRALQSNPDLAEAHELLGGLLSRKGQPDDALPEFKAAVRLNPDLGRAQLDLAATLVTRGDITAAIPHLEKAAQSSDPRISEPARRALAQLRR